MLTTIIRVRPCWLVVCYWCAKGACCLHLRAM